MPRTFTHTWFFYGDSLTLGVNDNKVPGGWVSRLSMLANASGICKYPPATFYNLGARRQKTADIAARWQAEMQNRQMPGMVAHLAFCVGVVDMAGPAGSEPQSRQDALVALEKILASAAGQVPCLLISPPPIGNAEASARIAELCAAQAEICKNFAVPYINIHATLAASTTYMGDLSDGLHPGPDGSQAMADLLFADKTVQDFLKDGQ